MHIIIVGCGKVGTTLSEQLVKEGHNVTVIDTQYQLIEDISNSCDTMGVVGNGASYSVQMEAGIDHANVLIAVTGSDELNLLCCLIAKKAGNCNTIARVRNPIYSKEIGFIKEELGLSMIMNPEYAAAQEIARLLSFPSAIEIDTFAKGRVELLKFKVQKDSIICNDSIYDIKSKLHCNVLVCTVQRGEEVIIPNGSFILEENDLVAIIASHEDACEFFMKIGIMSRAVKNALLLGGGDITYYLSKQLLHMGVNVKIIEQDLKRCEELSDLLPKAMIINGDATEQTLLLEEDIDNAAAFAALTNLDEENIMLSLFAKTRTKGKLITKINRITFDDVIESLDLGSIIYPKYLTAESIIQYVRAMNNSIGSNVETLYRMIGNKVEALEFIIHDGAPVVDIPLENLNLKPNILICCINRKGKIITPRGQDTIQVGDTVIVVTTNIGLHDIRDILAH